MDERTERLRDIFMTVSDEETVTEHQERDRWAPSDGIDTADRIQRVLAKRRDHADLRTDLDDDALVTVVRWFFAGDGDTAIANALGDGVTPRAVRQARLDLHLIVDRDLDAPFDLDRLRTALDEGRSIDDIADDLEVSPSTVRRYQRVLAAQRERRRVADRFREELEEIAADRDLGERLTASVRDTGLEDATEGMETNVSF